MVNSKENMFLERLSEIEHNQWIHWSKTIWDRLETIKRAIEADDKRTALFLLEEQRNKWDKNWIPYKQLDEKTKEFDRVWAKKVLETISSYRKNPPEEIDFFETKCPVCHQEMERFENKDYAKGWKNAMEFIKETIKNNGGA